MVEKVTIHEFLEIYARRIVKIGIPVIVTLIIDTILTRVVEQKSGSAQLDRSFVSAMNATESGISVEWAIYMALIFIGLIIVVTAVLLLCYWYGCMKAIFVWMLIAVALLLSYYVYIAIGRLPSIFNIPLDYISLVIFLLNLVVVGCMSIFWRAPAIVTQIFLVFISVLTALVFLNLPDWTVWILLVLLIFYDATVVLCPGGLLNLILKKTEERGDAIPALVYSSAAFLWTEKDDLDNNEENDVENLDSDDNDAIFLEEEEETGSGSGSSSSSTKKNQTKKPKNQFAEEEEHSDGVPLTEFTIPDNHPDSGENLDDNLPQNIVTNDPENPYSPSTGETQKGMPTVGQMKAKKKRQRRPQKQAPGDANANQKDKPNQNKSKKRRVSKKEGVKLGLGDFVFYGILVTRAARLGWDIAVLCIMAVMLGLSLTLVCLAVFERPLPALPFSLFLGIIFYITATMTFRPFSINLRNTLLVF